MKPSVAFFLMTVVCGCVPLLQHQDSERALAAEVARRKAVQRQLDACEVREEKLNTALKARPVATTINQAELDDIKKKAFHEAEEKYRSRIELENIKRGK